MRFQSSMLVVAVMAMPIWAATDSDAARKMESQVLNDLHRSNQMEMAMGQMAKDQGYTQRVRQYGEQLINDHEEADKRTQDVANQQNITLAETNQGHPANTHKLSSLKGIEFDRAFAKAMLEDHNKDVKKLEDAQKKLTDSPVKDLVDQVLPVLRDHQRTANDLTLELKKNSNPS